MIDRTTVLIICIDLQNTYYGGPLNDAEGSCQHFL